jgi:hypothetical protein
MQNQGDGLATAFEQRLEKWFGTIGGHAEEIALPLLEKDPALAGKEAKADDLIIAMILDQLGIDRWDGELRDLYQAQYLEVAKAASDVAERAGLGASLPDVVARSILAAGGRRRPCRSGWSDEGCAVPGTRPGRAEGEGATALANRIAGMVEAGPSDTPLTVAPDRADRDEVRPEHLDHRACQGRRGENADRVRWVARPRLFAADPYFRLHGSIVDH